MERITKLSSLKNAEFIVNVKEVQPYKYNIVCFQSFGFFLNYNNSSSLNVKVNLCRLL